MARRRKLQAGKGAKATVKTRYIRPSQHVPNNDKEHRSEVVLQEKLLDQKGKNCYTFRFVEDRSDGLLLHANVRWVKVTEEGDRNYFFDDLGEGEETLIKWIDSEARRLLYEDIESGNVTDDMDLKDIYAMRVEYAAYDFAKFTGRVKSIREIVAKLEERAKEDQLAFDKFVSNHEVSLMSRKGHIHWQGSEAQKVAKEDIKNGEFSGTGAYRRMWTLREEYYENFDFDIFRDKIRQEIGTGKYYHTLKVRGKTHKAS